MSETKEVRVDWLTSGSERYVFKCMHCGKEEIRYHGSKTTYYPGCIRKYPCCMGRHTPFRVTAIILRAYENETHFDAAMVSHHLLR